MTCLGGTLLSPVVGKIEISLLPAGRQRNQDNDKSQASHSRLSAKNLRLHYPRKGFIVENHPALPLGSALQMEYI
jgi:hypothetical protein